jgi:hypothetical protein
MSFLSSISACYWDPEVVFRTFGSYIPQCSVFSSHNGLSVLHVSKSTITSFTISPQKTKIIIVACDCPCDDLVEVESPPRSVMTLSYIAQALVVTIVGLNMGFRWCVGMRGTGGGKELQVKASVK